MMCGLCGFVRHPEAPDLPVAMAAGMELLLAMEARGSHATGMALMGGMNTPRIIKHAVSARDAVKMRPWKDAFNNPAAETLIMMGHTRHATHNNAKLDAAAHPFQVREVVGAHNGMIRNWEKLRTEHADSNEESDSIIVDSQAALLTLAAMEDNAKAIASLRGYWALTWSHGKDGVLRLTRTEEAPLAVCYVPEMLTAFYCSTPGPLTRVMREMGISKPKIQTPLPNHLYRLTPTAFGDAMNYSSEKLPELVTYASEDDLWRTSGGTGSRSGRSRIVPVSSSRWDHTYRRESTDSLKEKEKGGKGKRRPAATSDTELIGELMNTVNALRHRVAKLEETQQYLTAEVAELRNLFDPAFVDEGIVDPCQRDAFEVDGDDEEVFP